MFDEIAYQKELKTKVPIVPALTLNEYQEYAMQTATYGEGDNIIYPVLGLTGEAGEVANKVKKVLRDGGGVFTDEVKLAIAYELGDTLWYLGATANDIGYTLGQIGQMNIEKLAKRRAENTIQGSGDNR